MFVHSILIIAVGILWGTTDYLIGQSFIDYSLLDHHRFSSKLAKIIYFFISNLRPILFFALNQLGSVLFYICLGSFSLSLTVIISNSTSFITIMAIEYIHKNKVFNRRNNLIY